MAKKANEFGTDFANMFPTFGMSQEEVFTQQTQQRLAAALAKNDDRPERYAGENALQDAGVGFGSLLGNWLDRKKDLAKRNPEQARLIEAQEYAKTKIAGMDENLWLNSEGMPDGQVKQWYEKSLMAESLIQNGDERGYALGEQLTAQRIAYEKAEAERAKLIQEADSKAALAAKNRTEAALKQKEVDAFEAEQDRKDQRLAQQGDTAAAARVRARAAARNAATNEQKAEQARWQTFYPTGEADPTKGVFGYMGDDGVPREGPGGAPLQGFEGGATVDRPLKPPTRVKKQLGDDGYQIPPTGKEAANIIKQRLKVMTQLRLTDRVFGFMKEVSAGLAPNEQGSRPIFLGTGGKWVSNVVKFVDNINTLVSAAGMVPGKGIEGPDGKLVAQMNGSAASAASYVRRNKSLFESLIPIPAELRNIGSDLAERYQATVVQLAYAQAQLNEPGTGRLSDADFKNAIKQIGGAATNPRALRQIMFANVQGNIQDLEDLRGSYNPDVQKAVFGEGTPTDTTYKELVNRFKQQYSIPWSNQEDLTPSVEMKQAATQITDPTLSAADRRKQLLENVEQQRRAYQDALATEQANDAKGK